MPIVDWRPVQLARHFVRPICFLPGLISQRCCGTGSRPWCSGRIAPGAIHFASPNEYLCSLVWRRGRRVFRIEMWKVRGRRRLERNDAGSEHWSLSVGVSFNVGTATATKSNFTCRHFSRSLSLSLSLSLPLLYTFCLLVSLYLGVLDGNDFGKNVEVSGCTVI